VVRLAHKRGVHVEAQVGRLPDGGEPDHADGEVTDPEVAAGFIERTGIDSLAVSIGNVHILTNGKSPVQLAALDRIHAAVRLPLVVHGGTGFPHESIQEVVRRGVAKFNFGTVLKQAFLRVMRERLEAYQEPMNPHPFLGMGGPRDILMGARDAMTEEVKKLLCRFGSAGKA